MLFWQCSNTCALSDPGVLRWAGRGRQLQLCGHHAGILTIFTENCMNWKKLDQEGGCVLSAPQFESANDVTHISYFYFMFWVLKSENQLKFIITFWQWKSPIIFCDFYKNNNKDTNQIEWPWGGLVHEINAFEFFVIRSHLHFKPEFTSGGLKYFSKKLSPSTGNWTHNIDHHQIQVWMLIQIGHRGLCCLADLKIVCFMHYFTFEKSLRHVWIKFCLKM